MVENENKMKSKTMKKMRQMKFEDDEKERRFALFQGVIRYPLLIFLGFKPCFRNMPTSLLLLR